MCSDEDKATFTIARDGLRPTGFAGAVFIQEPLVRGAVVGIQNGRETTAGSAGRGIWKGVIEIDVRGRGAVVPHVPQLERRRRFDIHHRLRLNRIVAEGRALFRADRQRLGIAQATDVERVVEWIRGL
jgi:hypothetical protein